MRRVVSLFLPLLSVERMRRRERSAPRPEPRVLELPVDDDPGACSVPRGGGWRPGARWARDGLPDRAEVARRLAGMPAHARPPMRELGRRSEAAEHPFRGGRGSPASSDAATAATPASMVTAVLAESAPLVLVAKVGRQDKVVALCDAATALGVTTGMAATHARALVSDLDMRPAEPEADAELLARLALLAVRRWTPTVEVTPPDGLWLDLAGVAHLHGGEERFCRRLHAFCRRAGYTARVALADTPGAAHALARHGTDDVLVVPTNGTLAALSPLPVAALRLGPEALSAARRFGFDAVADLLPIARGPLARRLGLAAVLRLDQALGAAAEPVTAVTDPAAPAAERRLLEPIGTAETIARVMADLLGDLVAELRARGLGARSIVMTAERVDGGEQRVAVGTSRATRDAQHLMRLFRLRIERIDPGLGLERFAMVATLTEPLDATPLGAVLAGEVQVRDPARLVDVVAGRVGPRAVYRVAPVESHVPERVAVRTSPVAAPGSWPSWPRPVRLLARPELLSRVVALLPDHPPRRFEWRGTMHAVVAGDGPERVHGEWWRRTGEVWASRDYWRVEVEAGGRY